MASGPTPKAVRPPRLPAPGQQVFHFRLGRELGRGAFARVFLAEQGDLANRHVVVKCSTIEGSEPQTLAQLQHTNVVPIYSVHEDRDAGLRAVCMPYFGGASLSQVLQFLWNKTARPTQGAQLVQALEEVQAALEDGSRLGDGAPRPNPSAHEAPAKRARPAKATKSTGPTPLDLLKGLSYPRAAAWIVARLADGLYYAHQRGVLHRDIKPSNILLGADGQPMLLDFNLAKSAQDAQAQTAAVLGGTVAYMGPEHLRALASKEPDVKGQVDHRADIYALGMVLFEMLAGQGPFAHKASYSALPVLIELMAMERSRGVASVRRKRPDVPWSLESIVRKCLQPDPAQRYQHAGQLALDLRRFLEDQPLRYAPELSRTERVRKWFRRHPRLTSSVTVAAVAAALLAGTAYSLVRIRTHLASTKQELEVVQDQERKRLYEQGARRALCLVNTTADMGDNLRQGQEACREALALYGILDRTDWQEQPAWQRLSAEERQHLGEDARELLLLLAWTRVRSAPGDAGALREGLALLDKAEGIGGLPPSRALWEDRTLYRQQLGDSAGARQARETARGIQPAGVRDRYLLATSYARGGRYAEAIAELDLALRQNPGHYWSNFQRGVCYQEMGKYTLAVGDFGTCIGLWPEFALGYFSRGYSLDQSGAKVEAIRDYTAALERNPDLTPAYLNRGMACLELKRYPEALKDFDKVAGLGGNDVFLHTGRGVALEGLGRFAEADRAFAAAFTRGQKAPRASVVRSRWVYGFAVSARLPDKALAAFEDVLARAPNHAEALYGKAMLLAQKGRDVEALDCLDHAAEVNPRFVEARRCRAVLQARRGNLGVARQEIDECLARAPESGSVLYGAACVAAWTAERSRDPVAARQARERAVGLLARAFAHNYGRDKVAKDPDLRGIRAYPGFQRLVEHRDGGKHVDRK